MASSSLYSSYKEPIVLDWSGKILSIKSKIDCFFFSLIFLRMKGSVCSTQELCQRVSTYLKARSHWSWNPKQMFCKAKTIVVGSEDKCFAAKHFCLGTPVTPVLELKHLLCNNCLGFTKHLFWISRPVWPSL